MTAGALRIGSQTILNRVFLAPMSGVSDLPFRRLAHRLGAGLVVSEMIAGEDLVRQRAHVLRRASGSDITPFVIQLAGRESHWMAEGARIAEARGANIIDINMGCPAREVTGKLCGSALMRDLDHAVSLIEAVVKAVGVPVTVKMRLGWDDKSRNAPELARRAEAAGAQMITVHGRTRCQFFNGSADWTGIRDVVDAVSIPVVVNGDIRSCQDAEAALSSSGASGVMVGRGAYGAPWLPGRIAHFLSHGRDHGAPTLGEQGTIAREHVVSMLEHYGTGLGLRNARKHIAWYLEGCAQPVEIIKAWRRKLCTDENPSRVLQNLEDYFGEVQEAAA